MCGGPALSRTRNLFIFQAPIFCLFQPQKTFIKNHSTCKLVESFFALILEVFYLGRSLHMVCSKLAALVVYNLPINTAVTMTNHLMATGSVGTPQGLLNLTSFFAFTTEFRVQYRAVLNWLRKTILSVLQIFCCPLLLDPITSNKSCSNSKLNQCSYNEM